MREKGSRKEWIKTFAIIFLSILLVLTFFSNTIQNYSLPEVAVQYTNSGSITNKVRGEGTVEAADPYSVVFKSTRKIDSVAVKVGDEVKKGDVLYNLEKGDSEELKEAKKDLDEAKQAYEDKVIELETPVSVTSKIESGEAGTLESNQAAIASAKAKIEKAEKAKETAESNQKKFLNSTSEAAGFVTKSALEAEQDKWETQKDLSEDAKSNLSDETVELAKTYDAKKTAYDKAAAAYEKTKTTFATYKEKHPDSTKKNDTKYADLAQKNSDAKKAYEEAKEAFDAADKAASQVNQCNSAITQCTQKIAEYKKQIEDLEAEYQDKVDAADEAVTKAKEELSELTTSISEESSLKTLYKAIQEKEEKVKKLEETENGTTLVSPVEGTVLSLAYVAGETIEQGATVATVQLKGKGFTISMSITNEQAQLVKVGDEAEVSNSWWYSDVKAKVISIKADKESPQNGKVVTFQVEGEVSNGQTLSLTVGARTASYDNIVPSSAIREDNNGKFVYKVNSKSTPLGNRYILERVNVTVVASDDTKSAITGDLEGWDYIVTTSSKPLSDGQQVRLKD